MSTLYLAARFGQAELRGYAARLRAAGHVVTSRWLDAPGPAVGEHPAEAAQMCLEDMSVSGWFALFTDAVMGRGAKDSEMGWALHHGLHLRLVGPRINVFHYLPAITCYDSVDEFMSAMWA